MYSFIISAQVPQTKLKDILEFKVDTIRHCIAGWLGASSTRGILSGIEYDKLKNGNNIIFFTPPTGKNIKSECSIATAFLMPVIETAQVMEASLLCKNQGFDTVQVIFSSFNTYGDLLAKDTLKVQNRSDWHESTTIVHIKNVSYVHLTLEVKGNVSNVDKKLWIDKMQLKVCGKCLFEYPLCNLENNYVLDTTRIVKLSFSNSSAFKKIQMLSAKKIVALGESLHGSATLEESAIQIMKHRVLYCNCKLILLESPLEKILSINRFVLGDENFELDSIANNLDLSLYSENILDFIVWLREYNKNVQRKVYLLGMDASSTDPFLFATELFDYFYRINKTNMNASIKKFLWLILTDSNTAMGPILSSLKNDTDFKNNNDALEVKIIEHCWDDWIKVPDYKNVDASRDSIMYSNVRFMTDLLCNSSETVTLYSHLEHSCYDKTHTITNYPQMSYGSLLKKDFGDDYCTIGLFAYQGEVLSIPNKQQMRSLKTKANFIKYILEPIQSNSLEHLLYKSNLDYLYASVSLLPYTQLYIRCVTNAKQFVNIIHPMHYMDGIVFVKESEAIHVIHENISIPTKYQNAIKRFERYQSLVE